MEVSCVVSFIEVLKRLIPGTYSTMTGHPNAPEAFREFVREVKEKVPELRARDDWEVESTVLEAIDHARHKLCTPLKTAEVVGVTGDYYEGAAVYSCYHPDIGDFYLAIQEEEDAASGYGFFGFTLTRSKNKALEDYKSVIESWKERGVKYEEW